MNCQTRLLLSSVLFAALWTLGMIWWTGTDIANVVITTIGGTAAGLFWFFAMRWWIRHWEADAT
jgi:hypothetical protein